MIQEGIDVDLLKGSQISDSVKSQETEDTSDENDNQEQEEDTQLFDDDQEQNEASERDEIVSDIVEEIELESEEEVVIPATPMTASTKSVVLPDKDKNKDLKQSK